MHITMVKKKLKDGSECQKCGHAVEQLRKRGLLDQINEFVWAEEDNPDSPGHQLGLQFGVERAPFFIVRDDSGEHVYTSVMRLIRDRLGRSVSDSEEAMAIDPDDVGGI
jgi:hypothetical protein